MPTVDGSLARMNDTRKTVVFRCQQLLGDAIYATCVIGRYMRDNPETHVVIETLDEYPKEVYTWIPGSPEITFATDTPCDVRYEIDPTQAMHHAVQHKQGIWLSMGAIVGLPADDVPQLNIPQVEIPEAWKGAYVISPFSRSCTSHQGLAANKTFPTRTWSSLLHFLRRRGKLLIISAAQERLNGFSLDESDRVAGFSLATVASVMRHAKCVIALDNGLARIATLVHANVLVLMPDFLPLEVFAPAIWAIETSRVVQVDVTMDANAFAASMKHLLRVYAKVT
jgi:hypothetical protein